VITSDAPLDFEDVDSYTLTVTVTDQIDLIDTATMTITVTDVNEAPTIALSNTVTNLNENAVTTPRVKVADIATQDDALGDETLGLTGVDAALFEIDGSELFLKAGTALDFETNPTLEVTVTVDAPTVGGDSADLSIAIGDTNEAPSIALSNTVTSLADNAATTPRVKVADIAIADDALGNETLALAGIDAELFEIDGTELYLKADTALDFETKPTLVVTVTIDDSSIGETPDDSAELSIAIGNVNEAPSVNNASFTVAENAAAIGTVTATDPEDDTLNYAITGPFSIDSNGVITANAPLNFEDVDSYTLTVMVTDPLNLFDTGTVTIIVTNLNEAPSIADASFTVDENGAAIGTVTGTDPEDDELSYAITGPFSIDASGVITTNAPLDFEDVDSYSLTVTVADQLGLFATATVTITVTDLNEAPMLSLANTVVSLPEDETLPRKVADVVVDDDALGDRTLELIGEDAALFDLVGLELFLRADAVLDFETNPQLDVAVTVNDGDIPPNPNDSAPLSIALTNANEAPTVAEQVFTIAETAGLGEVIGTLVADDADAGDTLDFEIDGAALAINDQGVITVADPALLLYGRRISGRLR
jgi:protocadherin Fat 4